VPINIDVSIVIYREEQPQTNTIGQVLCIPRYPVTKAPQALNKTLPYPESKKPIIPQQIQEKQ